MMGFLHAYERRKLFVVWRRWVLRAEASRPHPTSRRQGESAPYDVERGAIGYSSIGFPENEVDPEICLAKGEVLLRAGRNVDAQLFFRQAPRLAPNRQGASAVTLRAAAQDLDFQYLIEKADRARDARAWQEAGEFYREALQAYRDHYGYMVQYAHCLKEQGEFAEAECHYRSALALGAPRIDVDEHLDFVLTRQGLPFNAVKECKKRETDNAPLDALPTKTDVELVVKLLLGREPLLVEVLRLLREHRTVRGLVKEVVAGDAFAAANASLLSHWELSGRRSRGGVVGSPLS